jgi:hypothetical protein
VAGRPDGAPRPARPYLYHILFYTWNMPVGGAMQARYIPQYIQSDARVLKIVT